MRLEDIRLGKSPLTDTIFAGMLDKAGTEWVLKKDLTNDFCRCVIELYAGYETIIQDSKGNKWSVVVKEMPKGPTCEKKKA